MKQALVTTLRNRDTSSFDFRITTEKLAYILAIETSSYLQVENFKINTPIESANGVRLKNRCMLVPILRSGMALLEPFLKYFSSANVGIVGIKRDEVTAIPNTYYKNIPKFCQDDDVIILDPMIATGGSAIMAINMLIEHGIEEEKIIFVAIISSESGLKKLKNNFPKIKTIVAQVDPKLNKAKFIVPGLGDFGDRYFGTE